MDVESCVGNVVTTGGEVFDGEAEPTELAGVYEVHNGDDSSQGADGSEHSPNSQAARQHSQADPFGDNPMKRRVFDREQYSILERYYDNGMNSTHRRNKDLVDEAAREVGVSADKVKNWIGAETVRRKRQALAVAGVKPSATGTVGKDTPSGTPAAKRKRSMSGYSLFLAEALKDSPEPSLEHKTDIAQRWRNMTEDEQLDWHQRARLYDSQQRASSATTSPVTPAPPTGSPPTTVEGRDRIVSYAVSLLQSCLERLDQVGVHSYCLLVDPIQMKTHTLASALGQQFHQQQQQQSQLTPEDTAQGSTSEAEAADSAGVSATGQSVQTKEEPATDTPMDTDGTGQDQSAAPEPFSVYTAFSRFVLSSALAQQPAAVPAAATSADSTVYQTAGHPHDPTAGVVVGAAAASLDLPFNPGTGTTVSSTLPLSLASSLGPSAAVVSPTGNACRYQTADGYICPYVATSPHFLRAHRLDTGHIAKRGRPRKTLAPGVGGTLPANSLMGIPALNLDAVASMASLASAAATVGTSTVTTSSNATAATPLEQQTVSEITVSSESPTVETTSTAQEDVSDLSVDHMVMLVRNTFNAKYEAATGVKSVPYDDGRSMENVVVYGLPEGLILQRPKLYSPEQLRAIMKELDRVVFLPVSKTPTEVTSATELTPTDATTAPASSNETVINNFVASVDTLMTDSAGTLNVVIESTPES